MGDHLSRQPRPQPQPQTQPPPPPPQEDKTDICFRDPFFLEHCGGALPTPAHALDYFSRATDFYVPSCINEQLKMQTRFNSLAHSTLDASKMAGVEYYTWFSDVANKTFHIVKHFRRPAPAPPVPMAAYYIVGGTVYQAPDLYSLISSRIRASLHSLAGAYQDFAACARFDPPTGYQWAADDNGSPSPLQSQCASRPSCPHEPRRGSRRHRRRTKSSVPSFDGGKEDNDAAAAAAADYSDQDLPQQIDGLCSTRATTDPFSDAGPADPHAQLLQAEFFARVDALIETSAQRQHVVLVAKPPPTPPPPQITQMETSDDVDGKGERSESLCSPIEGEGSVLLRSVRGKTRSAAGSSTGASSVRRRRKRQGQGTPRPVAGSEGEPCADAETSVRGKKTRQPGQENEETQETPQ